MTISENGLNLIKGFEGLVLHPYRDQVGVPTIGYGSTCWFTGKVVTMQDTPIDEKTANYLLEKVAYPTAAEVSAMVTSAINQNQLDALTSFAYNVGTRALHGSTLLKRVNANPADPTIRDAFMMWDKGHIDGQVVELNDLKIRRQKEADLYFS